MREPMSEILKPECPTCNGTGKEGRHSICRDCDEIVRAVCEAVILGEDEEYRPVHLEPRETRLAIETASASLTEERDRLREALTWMPISTADKDAIRLTLGIVRKGVLEEIHIGGYRYAINDDEESCWWSDQCDDEIVPTHWMAAPPPVEESEP